jgi:hypothetical protein
MRKIIVEAHLVPACFFYAINLNIILNLKEK